MIPNNHHILPVKADHFEMIAQGQKTFVIAIVLPQQDYQIGHKIVLFERTQEGNVTGRSLTFEIGHMQEIAEEGYMGDEPLYVISLINNHVRELEDQVRALEVKDFWTNWVYPEGASPEQIQDELSDFHDLMERASEVYSHVTGGRISKPLTMAQAVINEADAVKMEEIAEYEEDVAELTDGLVEIWHWCNAYPLEVFPEPDMKRVASILDSAGISLGAVSAYNMRHVLKGIQKIIVEKFSDLLTEAVDLVGDAPEGEGSESSE